MKILHSAHYPDDVPFGEEYAESWILYSRLKSLLRKRDSGKHILTFGNATTLDKPTFTFPATGEFNMPTNLFVEIAEVAIHFVHIANPNVYFEGESGGGGLGRAGSPKS